MSEDSLKERQIEVAQYIIDNFSRSEQKFKKVVDIDATSNHAEVIVHFSDCKTTKFVGLFAVKILAGRVEELGVDMDEWEAKYKAFGCGNRRSQTYREC